MPFFSSYVDTISFPKEKCVYDWEDTVALETHFKKKMRRKFDFCSLANFHNYIIWPFLTQFNRRYFYNRSNLRP